MPRKTDKLAPSEGAYVVERQADIARWFGAGLSTVRLWAEHGMPGKPMAYPMDTITRWVIDRKFRDSGGEEDDDTKKKLNEIKTRSAEIDLMAKERSYVPIHFVRQILTDFASAMRRAGEKLQRDHGPQAIETIQVCLEDMERTQKKLLAEWGIVLDDNTGK